MSQNYCKSCFPDKLIGAERELLLSELEPVVFAKALVGKDVWTRTVYDEMVGLRSRRQRAEFVLNDIQTNGHLQTFVSLLEELYPVVFERCCGIKEGSFHYCLKSFYHEIVIRIVFKLCLRPSV